jgi:Xaa-Pro aminopeptidase
MDDSEVIARRQARFRKRLARLGADAYWVVDRANVRYLCGFGGEDSTLLITQAAVALITDSRFEEQAAAEARADELVSRHLPMARTTAALCRKLRVHKLGLTTTSVYYADWAAFREFAPSLELLPNKHGIAEGLRTRKDSSELEKIRAALDVAQNAFGRLLGDWDGDWTEQQCAARLDFEMRNGGAQGPAFETICAAGGRSSMPHARTTAARMGRTGHALLDWGAVVDGYCCDLTRLVDLGRMRPPLRSVVKIVVEAQQAALEAIRPGRQCKEVDRAARRIIAKAGYGGQFGHACGHGVGLGIHEAPRLAADETAVLLPGMVLTLEPGVYLPGVGGVRIEDMVVVTDGGAQLLSTLPQRHRPEARRHD